MVHITVHRNNNVPASASSGRSETTTKRSLILKEITQLQKSEAALGKKLLALGSGFDSMPERIELQHQMHSIDEQIKALQNLLLQDNADRTVQSQDAPKENEGVEHVAASKTVPSDTKVGTVIDVFV
jgi:hypothetical protein